MRVDLIQAARLLSFSALADVWASVGYVPKMEVLARDFDEYRERLLLSGKARDVIQYSLF
ncbi:MAG: hypothetical protein HYY30_05705 [Chloroflexi bacterium]|nr:hypothetical protein [Chloroflexota bacterium]